jgi:hypothetical protein
MLTTEEGNFGSWAGCCVEICCSFSDVFEARLTVTDDIGAEFIFVKEFGLAPTFGWVGITIAVATLDAVIVVLLVVAEEDSVGNGVGVTVTPERLIGLLVDTADADDAGINVIDGEEEKLTIGCPLLLLNKVALTGGCWTMTAC